MADSSWLKKVVLGSYALIGVCALVIYVKAPELKAMTEYESSPIDWCEDNYEKSEWIVEFYNSVSSIPISFMAPLAVQLGYVPTRLWTEAGKIYMIFFLIVLIGAGSTYFHGTLSILGQIADEIPIIFVVLYSAILVLPKGKYLLLARSAFLPPVFIATVATATLLALFSPIISHVFVLSCVPFGLYSLNQGYKRTKNENTRQRFRLALRFFAAAWTCWLIDKFGCTQMQAIGEVTGFRPQLHACWHILVGIVCLIMISVCMDMREEIIYGSKQRLPRFEQIV